MISFRKSPTEEVSSFDSSKKVRTISQRITIGKYDVSEFVLRGKTTKSVADPAGQWEIELRPSILNGTVVNLGDININDLCEIRVGVIRDDIKDPPVIMRGLVDAVRVTETIQRGSPVRSVTISGRDFGKIFTEKNIVPPVEFINEISRARQRMFINVGVQSIIRSAENATVTPVSMSNTKGTVKALVGYTEFMSKMFKEVLTDKFLGFDAINQLISAGDIQYEINIPMSDGQEEYIINSQYTILQAQGSLWTWLSAFIPAPMFEFLVVDYDKNDPTVAEKYRGKTFFHLRWAPFRNKWGIYPPKGRFIADSLSENNVNVEASNSIPLDSSNAKFFNETKFVEAGNRAFIGRNEILSKILVRHDNDTRTFFFTKWRDYAVEENPSSGSQFPTESKKFDCRSSPQFTNASGPDNYGLLNCSLNNGNDAFNPLYDVLGMSRFGFKPMIVAVPFWNQGFYKDSEKIDEKNTITRILDNINQWMYDVFTQQHNIFSGEISMIGNPYIRIGQELFIVPDAGKNAEARSTRDDYEMYYVETVSHSWTFHPSVAFQTSVKVSRGSKIPYALTGLSQDITTDPGMAWEGLPIAGTSLVTTLPSAESLLADLYMTSPATVSDETASSAEEETTVVAEIQYDNSVVDEYEFRANNNEEIV